MAAYIGQLAERDGAGPEKTSPTDGSQLTPNEPCNNASNALPSLPKGEQLAMLLIGKTGQGKSETGNLITNKENFRASDDSSSVTFRNQSTEAEVGGRMLKVVDTPGCMDTEKGNKILKEIADAITTQPDGYDAFLIVVKYPARMTNEEVQSIKQLENIFGTDFYKYGVVIFTHGDCFKLKQQRRAKPMTFEEYVNLDENASSENSLGPLLRKVNKRAVLFSNFEEDPVERRKMVIELVKRIDEVKVGKGRYDNKLFQKAREFREKSGDAEQRSNWLFQYMVKIYSGWCNVM